MPLPRSAAPLALTLVGTLVFSQVLAAQYREDVPPELVAPSVESGASATLRTIGAHLGFLASDALGGRDTASVHGDVTAAYVASVFRAAGLVPGGDDGGFLQRFPLVSSYLDTESVVFQIEGEQPQSFVVAEQFALSGYGGNGVDLTAGVVFVGHGIVDAESEVDDYAGLEVEGQVVVALSGRPEGQDELRRAASSRVKRRTAREQGAAGLILVTAAEDKGAARMMGWARSSMQRKSLTLKKDEGGESTAFPRVYADTDVGRALFAAAGLDFEAEATARKAGQLPGFVLGDLQVTIRAQVAVDELGSDNAIGIMLGSDPTLADEFVVVSAHMDHVGIGADGQVYNGADDNASGTTALLVLADKLGRAASRPKRSVVLLAVSGEEKGLLGSEWWVAHPTVDLTQVVANVNIDMIGRNDPDSIGITPSDEHPEYNSMVPLAKQVGQEIGFEVSWHAGEGRYRKKVDDYYSRSDHANFSKAGIPVVFFFAGEHEDYHQATDTAEKIDQAKIAKLVELVAGLVQRVADAPERPVKLAD